jgi:endoglucanase
MKNIRIHIDQLGYRPGDVKRVVLPECRDVFYVCDADSGETVFTGNASGPVNSPASGETVRIADFSAVRRPGRYWLQSGDDRSYRFIIDEAPYGSLRKAVLDFYHVQKCGVDLDAGSWSHPACHTGLAHVLDTDGQKTGETKDVSGGWHDAGDYGRYIVPAAQTVAQLLLAVEAAPGTDAEVLDIVRFEIEWMLKMQDEATGGVYHKVGCWGFNPLNEMPHLEKGELVLSPVSAAATADFAAAAALASRFYPEMKNVLLEAAIKAWGWCAANPDAPGFTNPRGVSTGEYGDKSSADERFWAACELFAATGDESYHNYIKNAEITTGLGWRNMGTYGIAAYLGIAGDKADAGLAVKMKETLIAAARELLGLYRADPYGVSLGTDHRWGSCGVVGNNAMTLLLAHMFDHDPEYTEAAAEHMRYLLGKNPLSKCFISGFGSNPMKNPHHRPSVATGCAVPGMVSGGPDGACVDSVLKRLCKGGPPMKCYADRKESYSSNEVTIYWNSPVYYVLAKLGL